jgi:hypothetical protein
MKSEGYVNCCTSYCLVRIYNGYNEKYNSTFFLFVFKLHSCRTCFKKTSKEWKGIAVRILIFSPKTVERKKLWKISNAKHLKVFSAKSRNTYIARFTIVDKLPSRHSYKHKS